MALRFRPWIVVMAGSLALIVAGLFLIRSQVGWFYLIPQNGMYPNLPAGSWIIGRKHPYRQITDVVRGDVILFEREEAGQRLIYVGRVIGLPGDTVEAAGNRLLLNSREVNREELASNVDDKEFYEESLDGVAYTIAFEPYLPAKVGKPGIPKPGAPLTIIPITVIEQVPADHLFIMGDNRRHTVDSRTFGPIPWTSIVGKKW